MKNAVDELACFGGDRAFDQLLHVGRPNLGDRERFMERMNDIWDRRWLTNGGKYVQEFEAQVARQAGTEHCVAMANGTVALEITARALGMKNEVLVPACTFVATAHALQWQEIQPVFCDVDPATGNLDPRGLERMITPRTSGIVGVHLWGRASHLEELTAVAKRNNLPLIFDAAHAFGITHRQRPIGSFGHAAVFSFHATKFINSFEGGAVVTNDGELAKQLRLMKNFGFVGMDKVTAIGTNGKMNEACAAMGLTSLESMEDFVAHNRRNYEHYLRRLNDIPGLRLLEFDERERNNYQYIVVTVAAEVFGLQRDDVVEVLHAEGALARRYFAPGCHRQEPYRSYYPHAHLLLPRTEELLTMVMSLPTGTAMAPEDIDKVCDLLAFMSQHAAEIRRRDPKASRKV